MICYRDKLIGEFQKRHGEGWTDSQFAREYGLHKTTVMNWRRLLGLASNLGSSRDCEYRRKRFVDSGLDPRRGGLGHQRGRLQRGAELGWPGELESTAKILTILYEQGPKTKTQLAAMLGLKHSRTKTALAGRRGYGLRDLIERGLVSRIGTVSADSGRSLAVYAIALCVDRVLA